MTGDGLRKLFQVAQRVLEAGKDATVLDIPIQVHERFLNRAVAPRRSTNTASSTHCSSSTANVSALSRGLR